MKHAVMLCAILAILTIGLSQAIFVIEITGHSDKIISFETKDDTALFLRIVDDSDHAVKGISKELINLKKYGKEAKVLACTPLTRSEEVSQKIVMVLDNSSSMLHALNELHQSLQVFLKNLGGASEVAVVLFDENSERLKINNISADGKLLKLRVNDFTNDHEKLLKTCKIQIAKGRLTYSTYLNDAVYYAMKLQAQQPDGFQKSIIVLSDGVDRGSEFTIDVSLEEIAGSDVKIYGIDFSDKSFRHHSLEKIVNASDGLLFKAENPEQLVNAFEDISTRLTTVYLVKYKIPIPPSGSIAAQHDTLKIINTLVLDESPLLNYVFFDYNKADLNAKYHLLENTAQTLDFDETKINNPLDKYYHVLNVVGSRLSKHPDAKVTLTGCNCNKNDEHSNKALSLRRAKSAADYLTSVWGVGADRIEIKSRNLPEKLSSIRTPEGLMENQRVEITSNNDAILQPIKSVIVERNYTPAVGDFDVQVSAEEGLSFWRFSAWADEDTLYSSEMQNMPDDDYYWNWITKSGEKLHDLSSINYGLLVCDKDDETFQSAPKRIVVQEHSINSMAATINDDKIVEKYSLILFDFNSSSFGEKNDAQLTKVVESFRAHDSSEVAVFGFCDDIGDEKYNERLSTKRAQGVYRALLKNGVSQKAARFEGYGEFNPIFDNATPEGRFLNRTVQVYVSYPKERALEDSEQENPDNVGI